VDDPLAIYIHWPYCARICPYCDFNVYKNRSDSGLVAAIVEDLKGWHDWSGPRHVRSIHFGGGTPSLLQASDICKVINSIKSLWDADSDTEIAIEANPQDIDEARWQGYCDAGINRLSLGVQTFHDAGLKLLGRDHDSHQARKALDVAIAMFPSVSVDLIFGWRGQTVDLWQQDIDTALNSTANHISSYQLTIEDGTAFAKAEARGDRRASHEDKAAEFFDMARAQFTAAGYDHYEVSNFAKPGHRSKHNMSYWLGHDYVGVGPGAHGRLTVDGQRYATLAAMRPSDYQTQVQETGLGIIEKEQLINIARAEEYVLMGLRINEGISLTQYRDLSGEELSHEKTSSLIKHGFLKQDGDRLKATPKGRRVLNTITEKLLTEPVCV